MRRRAFLTVASAAATSAMLAACSTGPTQTASSPSAATPSSSGGAAASGFPVTIKHAYGSTTINSAPSKIAALGWSDADIVLSLGQAPVGAPAVTWGGNAKKSTDFFDAALAKHGGSAPTRYDDADGAPIAEVAKLQPDLIVATNSGITKDEYTRLSKIAPVVAYPGAAYGTSWQDSTTMIGQAMGRSTQASSIIKSTEEAISAAAAKYPKLKGKTAAWLYFTPADTSKFTAYTVLDNRPRMLTEFGMKTSPTVVGLSKGKTTFSVDISAEKANTFDAQVAVFYIEKPGQDATVKSNALLGQIPALKSGAYVATGDFAAALPMSSPTPLSIPVAISDFLPLLAQAAGKVT